MTNKNKSPGPWARGFRCCASVRTMRSVAGEDRSGELVVQAGANDVARKADVVHQRSRRSIEAAEIDIEIFDLRTPVAQEGVFDADTGGPTELVVGRRSREAEGRHAQSCFDVAVSSAAGDVRQPAVEGVAEPAAQGGEPIELGSAEDPWRASDLVFDVGPIEVAFDAPDDRAGLIVVAKRAAGQKAFGLVAGGRHRGPVRGAPAVAAVHTDVEAGPVVVGNDRMHPLVDGARYVGRLRRERTRKKAKGRECRPENFAIHHLVSHPTPWIVAASSRCRSHRAQL